MYKYIIHDLNSLKLATKQEHLDEAFNILSKEGYELVSFNIIPEISSIHTYFVFKKKI